MKEVRYTTSDFVKYMDTTVPRGVNRKLFTYLKYSNRNKISDFMDKYTIPREVVEKVALHEFMKQDDETILRYCDKYMEKEKT